MARSNKGKKFEDVIKESFLKIPDVSIDRLRDAPRKLKGVDNPSDFIVYKYPHEIYVECKSHKGNTLPFSCIREEQFLGLEEKFHIEGVLCGLMIWFIDKDITAWVSIDKVLEHKGRGNKSINVADLDKLGAIYIQGKKKRVYFDYFMDDFLRQLYECDN